MQLQVGGGDLRGNSRRERESDDLRLRFTEGKESHPPGFEDGFHTHGDGTSGDVSGPTEGFSSIADGHLIQFGHVGGQVRIRSGLVESDMAVAANAL